MPSAASTFHPADRAVVILYFAATMGIGFYFYRKTRSVEGYTAGNRSLPGWVCGLSILATYVSSISYLALPGKSFAGNWNAFAFSLSIPIVAIVLMGGVLTISRVSWPKIASLVGREVETILHAQMAPVIGVIVTLIAGSIFAKFASTQAPSHGPD